MNLSRSKRLDTFKKGGAGELGDGAAGHERK